MKVGDYKRGALAETLAYWFLRLNGFLTTENFIVHPDRGASSRGKRTDADVVGIRFPHRNEQEMNDHKLFRYAKVPFIAIVEATAGDLCKVNGAWSNPTKGNLERLLLALGFFDPTEVPKATAALYRDCAYQSSTPPNFYAQYIAIGHRVDEHLRRRHSSLIQMTWSEVLNFIHERFSQHRLQKIDNQCWRADGRELWMRSAKRSYNFVSEYTALLKHRGRVPNAHNS